MPPLPNRSLLPYKSPHRALLNWGAVPSARAAQGSGHCKQCGQQYYGCIHEHSTSRAKNPLESIALQEEYFLRSWAHYFNIHTFVGKSYQ